MGNSKIKRECADAQNKLNATQWSSNKSVYQVTSKMARSATFTETEGFDVARRCGMFSTYGERHKYKLSPGVRLRNINKNYLVIGEVTKSLMDTELGQWMN